MLVGALPAQLFIHLIALCGILVNASVHAKLAVAHFQFTLPGLEMSGLRFQTRLRFNVIVV